MIAIARKVILLCDRRKIGRESFARFAEPDQMDVLVTDQLDAETRVLFEEAGMEVVVAQRTES